jgi:acylphosphatase
MRQRFLVSGRVQGVGFRYFARRVAGRLGLVGWVRNLPDGGVEAVAEGSPEDLARFLSELRIGPTLADVTKVRASPTDSSEALAGFEIRPAPP